MNSSPQTDPAKVQQANQMLSIVVNEAVDSGVPVPSLVFTLEMLAFELKLRLVSHQAEPLPEPAIVLPGPILNGGRR